MSTEPKQRLTWFLLKPDIDLSHLDSVVEPPDIGTLHNVRIPLLHKTQDTLFIKSTPPVPPKWLGYVGQHVAGGQLPRVFGASSSGLLLVISAKRAFAVTFGYGRWLVREEMIVQDFGLKVVLNSVNPAQIKSVDARTFDELTVHTRRGVSHNSPLTAFELDVTRNLLRGITGTSDASYLPGQITGAASLAMNTPVQFPQLPELGSALITTYKAKRYRKHFRFIDDMRAERDPSTIEALDELLLDALKSGEITDMHLAIPEAVDWQEIAGVRFSFKQKRHEPTPDPSVSIYRALRNPATVTIDRLKKDKVQAVSALDPSQLKGQWRVYDCIVFETVHNTYLYVLSGGDWYRVNKSYRESVEAFVRTIPKLNVGLPMAIVGDDEGAYNERAAEAIGALCLDRKLVKTGGPDSVEICDILTRKGIFIHVKKRGRSSTLSHLFAQGIGSAELLLHDDTFLVAARAVVGKLDKKFVSAIPTTLRARDRISIAFVILSRSRREDTPHGLPFFSLMSLQAAARHLLDVGIQVYVQQVKET
ncbi:MAG TPA: DUF6119 family protein [Solirubrobacteraceae bacterium]|nr:DUF6119 family protein [Solirubrobacteraceae bacterium]